MIQWTILLASVAGMLFSAGCHSFKENSAQDALKRARLRVTPTVLDQYVGTYRLASGAHYPVVRDSERLLGGTPPHELLAQTTRGFNSNHLPGEFHFERSAANGSMALIRKLGDHKYRCERIDPNIAADPVIRVSAGEHQLRMLIAGSGSPTIVLEDGIGNGIEWQAELQADLAKHSRVVAYDHAGTGGSDPGPLPRDGRRIAHELRQALQSASLAPPFLLTGSSIGAEYIRIFAHEFPSDTAGLILLDPTPDWELLMQWAEAHAPGRSAMYRQFAHEAEGVMNHLMSVQEPGRSAEWDALAMTREQARKGLLSPDLPILQITGAGGRQTTPAVDDKVRFFDAWLREHLPHAKHVLAPHSGHGVTVTDRKLVLDEVGSMLKELRQRPGKSLP